MRLVNIAPPLPFPLFWFSFDLQRTFSSPGMMELVGFTRRWCFLFTLTYQGVMAIAVHVCFYTHTWESVYLDACLCGFACVGWGRVWICVYCKAPEQSLNFFSCFSIITVTGQEELVSAPCVIILPLSAWFGLIHLLGWWGGEGGEEPWASWHGGDW